MIHELCNKGNEHHIDTFYKIAVFEASQLPYFSHMTKDDAIEDIITNLPDSSQVLITDLLENNLNVGHTTRLSASGKLFSTNITFTITPQDKNLQQLLDTYNDKEVVVLVSKRTTSHLYGTSIQPLVFKYDELNSPVPSVIKGYNITISGSGYGNGKIFEDIEFNIYSRGLAFELARQI